MTVEIALQIIFLLSLGIIIYTYLGYPTFVYLVSVLRPKRVNRAPIEPLVSIIITAYNEEKALRAKIENTLRLDYPKHKLEIIIASDGSTDKTDSIAGEFANQDVMLFRQDGRVGKTFTQNKAVDLANGEIILFSDATTMYRPEVLRAVLPNFADETVGCVAGRLEYVDPSKSAVGKGARGYWSFETFLKRSESHACSLIGVSGALYAVRKAAYLPMYPEACSDFLICTELYRQGLRSVFEEDAVCTEETNSTADREFRMRVRIISQTLADLWRNRDMLNPLKSGFFAVQLFSHKVLRYSVPFFLLLIGFSTAVLALNSSILFVIFGLQLSFYFMAGLNAILEKKNIKAGVLAIPYYFVLSNLSALFGLYKFLRGERFRTWEPMREIGN